MSWEMYEAAKKIADGWYSELEATRMRNAVLGRDNAKLRELVRDIRICARDNQCSLCYLASGKCDFSNRMCELGVAE